MIGSTPTWAFLSESLRPVSRLYSAGQCWHLVLIEASYFLLHELELLLQLIGSRPVSRSLLYHNFTTQTSLVQKSRPENSDVCSNRSECNDWSGSPTQLQSSGFIFATGCFLSTPEGEAMLLNCLKREETNAKTRGKDSLAPVERTLPLGGFGSGKVVFLQPDPPLVNSGSRCSNFSAKSFCLDRF